MKVTIIYDNVAYMDGLSADWGFSCLVEMDNFRILFDTGANSAMLLNNMERLNIDPRSIDEVFISHAHWDHAGGLADFLEVNKHTVLYLPASMASLAKSCDSAHAVCVKQPLRIHEGILSTGTLQGIEQSMVVSTAKGLAVIAGCSHPGVGAILTAASRWGKVYALIGGLHGFREFDLLRDLGCVCPCHCTQFKSRIEKLHPEIYNCGGVGRTLQL